MKYFPRTPGVFQAGSQARKKILSEERRLSRELITLGAFSAALVDPASEIKIIFRQRRDEGNGRRHTHTQRKGHGEMKSKHPGISIALHILFG